MISVQQITKTYDKDSDTHHKESIELPTRECGQIHEFGDFSKLRCLERDLDLQMKGSFFDEEFIYLKLTAISCSEANEKYHFETTCASNQEQKAWLYKNPIQLVYRE
jgi:hypothetical protein